MAKEKNMTDLWRIMVDDEESDIAGVKYDL